MSKSVNVTLTYGAITLLKTMLPEPLWYKGQSQHALPAIGLLERLADYEIDKGDHTRAETVQKLDIPMTEWQSAKACTKWYLDEGRLGLTRHVRNLLIELDLES